MGIRAFFLGAAISVFCFDQLSAQSQKWQALEVEADTLLNRQDFKGAAKIYSKIIKSSKLKDQAGYSALYKRAVCLYSMGKFEAALKDLDIFIPAYSSS